MPAYNPAVALIISRRRSRQRAKKSQSIKQSINQLNMNSLNVVLFYEINTHISNHKLLFAISIF